MSDRLHRFKASYPPTPTATSATAGTVHDAEYHLSPRKARRAACRAAHPGTPYRRCNAYRLAEAAAAARRAARKAFRDCIKKAKEGDVRAGEFAPAA
jgi:hypothetical protein